MAGKVGIVFSFFVLGDGTEDPVTVDLRYAPIYLGFVDPIAPTSAGVAALTEIASTSFDILRNPPTGVILGSYSGTVPEFDPTHTGDFSSASLSGYQITVTPNLAFSNVQQVVGMLTFG